MNLSPFHPDVLDTMKVFFFNFAFWGVVVYIGACISLSLFMIEVSDILGLNVFKNFITSRYHRPREEERIFMFLDMKSSTTIAEKLGHLRYYELLNQYYEDISDAILNTYGEVYQYVGDEIIVSWQLGKGLEYNNCLKCFFMIKQIFAQESKKYIDLFGLVPGFKAGIHCGKVTSG